MGTEKWINYLVYYKFSRMNSFLIKGLLHGMGN